jgi:DNA polymerase-3 subunit delta
MVAPSAASAVKFLSAPPDAVRGFLFYGTDSLQISARAETVVKSLSRKLGSDVEVIRLHDSDIAADPDRIIGELTTGSLFGGTKIIWLTSFPAKGQAAVLEAITRPLTGAYLAVQAPDLKKSHKLVQAFEAAPGLAALASYGEDRESLTSMIRQHVSSAGYEIDNDAAALVAARCDFSALLAKSEAEKLMTFAGTTRRIMADDVEACLIDQQTAGLSEIIDNALNGEGRKALVAFERFMAEEQNIVPILVVLSSTLLRMHALRTAMDAGTPIMQAIKELRPPVFFKQQDTLAGQVRRWPADALTAYLRLLNTTLRETRLKPSLAEDLTEEIVLKIAKTARGLRSS